MLTNPEVIAIDQDALGFQGVRVAGGGQTSVWSKPLGRAGARAVALLNQSDTVQDIAFSLSQAALQNAPATLRDVWNRLDLGSTDASGQFSASVAPHAVLLLEVVGKEPELPAAGEVAVSSLMPIDSANAIGPVEMNRANGGDAPGDGGALSIRGVSFDSGLGVAAGSLVAYRLGARCTRFRAVIGVDDQASEQGTVAFEVWGDHRLLFQSDILDRDSVALPIDVDITGVFRLRLKVTNGLDGGQANGNAAQDFASWADARIECAE
jgi:alpha-galactosidase